MRVQLTAEDLKLFFTGQKKHKSYKETVDEYDKIRMHANKEYPKALIEERRPSESTDTHAYRKKIYKSKTSNPIKKVLSSLSKIRRSQDWSIKYDETKVPASIKKDETLEEYCEKKYPGHDSVTNWLFSHLLKNQMIDANAVIAVLPLSFMVNESEYLKPVATIFNSDQVIYFEEGADFAILKSTDKSDIRDQQGVISYNQGQVYYYITTTEIMRYEEIDLSGTLVKSKEYYFRHDKGELPVFKVRGVFLKHKDRSTIQISRIEPMVEDLDEAAREYSDLQAGKVQHAHPLFWYYDNKECKTCSGTGKVIDGTYNEDFNNDFATGSQVVTRCQKECERCSGTGKVKFSPYVHIAVNPPSLTNGENTAIPTPPAGYIQRDVEVMKFLSESVKLHLYDALSSINMQFLDQTPLNISGEAKQVDREELNNFVYSVAEDLIYTADKTYYWINEWRYAIIVPDKNARAAMLPKIAVPENFDLLPSEYLIKELTDAKTNKLNPVLISAMEHDYANKKFYTNPDLSDFVSCMYELDPLPALTEEDKMTRLSNHGISEEDYIISCNIVPFIKNAANKDKNFYQLPYEKKLDALRKMAKEKKDQISLTTEIKANALPDQEGDEDEPKIPIGG